MFLSVFVLNYVSYVSFQVVLFSRLNLNKFLSYSDGGLKFCSWSDFLLNSLIYA